MKENPGYMIGGTGAVPGHPKKKGQGLTREVTGLEMLRSLRASNGRLYRWEMG